MIMIVVSSSCSDPYVNHMLSSLLQGIVVFVQMNDGREYKERLIMLDSSLLKLLWMSINSNKVKMHEFRLQEFYVSFVLSCDD